MAFSGSLCSGISSFFPKTMVAADLDPKLFTPFFEMGFLCILATQCFCECPQTKLQKQETCLSMAPSSKLNLTSKICLVLFTLHSFQVLVFGIMFRVDHCYLKESQSVTSYLAIYKAELFVLHYNFFHSFPTHTLIPSSL